MSQTLLRASSSSSSPSSGNKSVAEEKKTKDLSDDDGAAGGGHGYDLAWLKEAVKERHVQAQNWWENKDVKAAVAKGNTEEW